MIPADAIREILMEVVELSSLPTDPNRSNYIAFKSSEDEA
jgi:2-phosphoglycerate kinase